MSKKLIFLVVVFLLINFQSSSNTDGFTSCSTAAKGGEIVPFAEVENGFNDQSRRISIYDDIMMEVATIHGYDWRMIAAIAYCESRFNNAVRSARGARGLMQIMPIVAKHFDVPREHIADPRTNVMLGAKLIGEIEQRLDLGDHITYIEKMKFILASYNSGISGVSEARKLASQSGDNPNLWSDVARHGKLKSSRGVVAFVDQVVGKYSSYCIKYPYRPLHLATTASR